MSIVMADPSRRVDAVFAGPEPQRRFSVLLRLILAIPIVVVAFFVGIAFVVVVVIAWFAALFMGRLPRWAHEFLSNVVRWFTRIHAYLLLLTDRYPPFSFGDTDFPVRPLMPAPGRLNRWAVLFRLVIQIPAAVFLQIVQYGLMVPLILVAWVIVLFRGQMPTSLYYPYAALVRYSLRLSSYECMVTSEYAWGMLGDRPAPMWLQPPVVPPPPVGTGALEGSVWPPAPAAPHVEDAPAPVAPPQYPPPQYPPPQYPPPQYPPPQYPPPQAPALPGGADDEGRSGVSLVLTGAARGFMIFAIVWGSVLYVGQSVIQDLVTGHHNDAAAQSNTVISDYSASAKTLVAAGEGRAELPVRLVRPAVRHGSCDLPDLVRGRPQGDERGLARDERATARRERRRPALVDAHPARRQPRRQGLRQDGTEERFRRADPDLPQRCTEPRRRAASGRQRAFLSATVSG